MYRQAATLAQNTCTENSHKQSRINKINKAHFETHRNFLQCSKRPQSQQTANYEIRSGGMCAPHGVYGAMPYMFTIYLLYTYYISII